MCDKKMLIHNGLNSIACSVQNAISCMDEYDFDGNRKFTSRALVKASFMLDLDLISFEKY